MKYLKQTRIQAILFNVMMFPLLFFVSGEYLALSSQSFSYPTSFLVNSFMHAGLLHLAMNMLFTYQFGGLIDSIYQKKERYLLYFGLAIPITIVMFIYLSFVTPEAFLVGYSGVAMGLVGAGFKYLDKRNKKWVGGQLIFFHIIVIIFAPQVSWEAHLVGFIFGMLYSYNRFWYKPPQNMPTDREFEDKRSISNF